MGPYSHGGYSLRAHFPMLVFLRSFHFIPWRFRPVCDTWLLDILCLVLVWRSVLSTELNCKGALAFIIIDSPRSSPCRDKY